MTLTDFSTLTFDCYGTLIDWERGILAELRPWAARHGLALADEAILEAFGEAESACEAATPNRPYPDILADVLRRLAGRWGVAASGPEAAACGRSVGRWPAFPDSPAALQYLKRHYRMVIISNVDRASFAESNARLGVAFDRIVTAQDVGAYKPDRRNFEYALRELAALGVSPGDVLHVAQSLFHDIAPARALGLRTAWINRRRGRAGPGATPPAAGDATPDIEVASLAELVALHRAHLGGAPA